MVRNRIIIQRTHLRSLYLTLGLLALFSLILTPGCAGRIMKQEGPAVPTVPHQPPPFSVPAEARKVAATNLDEVLAKSAKSRWMSVVVRLQAERDKRGRATPEAVRSAQKALQEGLSGTAFTVKHLFRHIPYATLELDRTALLKLAKLKVVAGVSEEAEYYPFLAQSSDIVDASWSFKQAFSGRGAAVAILDGGTVHHPFFGDRLVEEFCFSSPGSDTSSLCRHGAAVDSGSGAACAFPQHCEHGTHVAGIAAGDGSSFSGIARQADIIALNASVRKSYLIWQFDGFLNGDLVAALEQVLDLTDTRNVAAVNMSLGGDPWVEGTCDTFSENERSIKEVADLLKQAGVATVAASGNEGEVNKIASPACISSVISVGSTDKHSVVAADSDSSGQLDFLAPGVNIVSSVPGGFRALSGTSMAAPHVTGAWAVLKAEKPAARVDDIEAALKQSGKPITDARQHRITPMIQVEEALHLVLLPEVRMFPENGDYQTPLEVQIDVIDPVGSARDLKTWVTTNGHLPEENAPGSVLLCEDYHCDFSVLTLQQHGIVLVLARAFFTLPDNTRASSQTATAVYILRDPLPGPASVLASDGTFTDRVRVTWTAVPNADSYDVFAGFSSDPPDRFAQPLNTTPVTETTFDHFPGTGTGDVLNYFVRGRVDGFPTRFGGPDTGYAQVGSILVTATDGTDAQGVRLTWDPTTWKSPGLHAVYEVYRSTDAEPGHAALIARLEGTFVNNYPAGVIITPAPRTYLDQNVTAQQTYFYWVKGIDGADSSRLGDGESGFFSGP
ncbi:MAG TPA: S8 family serine peptidase [Nitrospirota bacterium]|nr:S8 family serine peptidase [Nitrospirota bacterium]